MASNRRLDTIANIIIYLMCVTVVIITIVQNATISRTPIHNVDLYVYDLDTKKFAKALADSLNKDLEKYGLYYEIESTRDDTRFKLKQKIN